MMRVLGVKGEREVRTILTEQGNAPRRRRGVDENTGRNRSCCCSCRLDRSLRQTASRVQTQSATRQWRTVLNARQLRAIISCGNDGPNLIGCRGMGIEIGAGLSRTRTGPDLHILGHSINSNAKSLFSKDPCSNKAGQRRLKAKVPAPALATAVTSVMRTAAQ